MLNKKSLSALLLVAACGSNPPSAPDSSNANASILIADKDGPKAGVKVAFVNPDGKVAADVATGADGRAEATIVAGASVTAEVNGLTTITGVNPGDALTIQPTADADAGKDKGPLMVTFKAEPGAASYTLLSPCTKATGTTSPLPLPAYASCSGDQTLVAVATDASGKLLGYAIDKKVSIQKGDYKISSDWKQPDTFTADVAGLGASLGKVQVALATSVGFSPDKQTVPTAAATATATLNAILDKAIPAGIAFTVDDAAGTHHQTLLMPLDADATSVKLDASKDLLAWITGASYDAKAHTASVTTSAGDVGQLLEIDLSYGQKAWHVFGPSKSGTASIALPTLPASLAGDAPGANDTVTAAAALIDVEGSKDTYDTLKLLAPWAQWKYAGHPETTSLWKVRISK
jgi:hypothetical protein